MGLLRDYLPALKYGNKILPNDIAGYVLDNPWANIWYVDGTNGNDSDVGNAPNRAFATIQAAVTAASRTDIILIRPKAMATGATDPSDYAETIIIPADKDGLALIGINTGRTQGGLPQIKKGSGSTALLTIRAPGCLIANLGFNGASATGGGILLDDDSSTKTAIGTTIYNCHFKNCKGSTATNAATGGAIQWASTGCAWQVLISSCRFYKNVGDIVLLGTSVSVPQDVIIENCVFSGPAASVDCQLYLAGGSGMNGVIVRDCEFPAMPAIGSGTNARYIDMTGCVGQLVNCHFASIVSPTGSEGTFAAAGSLAKVPATVFITSCWGETTTSGETGEIFRT